MTFPILSIDDRMGDRLGGDLAVAEEVRLITKVTYLRRGPLGGKLTEMPDEPGFASWLLVNGFGVGEMLIVLVQARLEKVQVSRLETLAPFLHELNLWRDGHCDEASRG